MTDALLLKDNTDILAPFLVQLTNRCLLSGWVPILVQSKVACITLRLKKTTLTPRPGRPEIISADRELIGPIEAARASFRLLELVLVAAAATVCIPSRGR